MNSLKNKKIVVVGAGIGGLSAAAYLAKEGAEVTVIEKNSQVGGRASIIQKQGFTFDIGPSWYLMPDVFEDFYKDFGYKPEDFFELKKLNPYYRIFTKEEIINIPTNLNELYDLFDKLEPNGGQKLKDYLLEAQEKYEVSLKSFVYNSYRDLKKIFTIDMAKQSTKLTLFTSMEDFVKSKFSSPLAQKILQYSVIFLGASPKNSPALYSLISHADLNLGVFYPMKGIYQIPESIKKICEKNNVKFLLNESVTKIQTENGIAKKVITAKANYDCDYAVVNADYQFAETNFLDKKDITIPAKKWEKMTLAPSGFILLLGINKKLKNLTHHNFVWKEDWSEHFKTVFDTKELPRDFSFYICAPSVTDPSVAPENQECVFVLIPSAVGVEDTPQIRKHYRDLIIKEMQEYTKEDFEDKIVFEDTFFIKDFEQRYNAYKGTGLGLAHTLFQSAFFRPKNFSKKVKNLYYTGQYTNPGTGMPMVLISSKIVLNEILANHE